MTDKTICRNDGRCEYAIQSGAEGSGHCPNGKCAMPQPAAHLAIPGALEWDGDNGTHGADGESRANGEYHASSSGPEGKRERFQKWVMATKHPTFGFLDGRSLARGDDREGYADEYVQGLWVSFKEFDAQLVNTEQSRRSFFDLSQDLEKRLVALKAFAGELISGSFEGGNFDGGDIQDIGVKHGLLRVEQRTEECGEVCACREYGFPAECYRKTDLVMGGDQ
jgi:hypothetical protein